MNNTFLSAVLAMFVCVLLTAGVSAQSSCPNTGFEDGDFTNWTGGLGSCCPINVGGTNIVNGRHTIMTGPGMDANTDDAIPVVAPGGGLFSARLGNDQSGNEAERLTYSMTVDASNSLFIYRYAVVLEDPSHSASEQPRFDITMFDQNGAPIDCGVYSVTSAAGIPGFVTLQNQFFTTVNYKDWTTWAWIFGICGADRNHRVRHRRLRPGGHTGMLTSIVIALVGHYLRFLSGPTDR